MSNMSRRRFLGASSRGAAAAAAGSLVWGVLKPGRVLGANERVRLALVGCGGRGRIVARGLVEATENAAEVSMLCDLKEDRLADAANFIGEVQERKPKLVRNMDEVFESSDVDAVVVATPDHWHSPAAIRAVQAEKHVYVEKPHSHNIWESRQLLEASRKYNRLVQVGTQNRSGPYNIDAREYVKSGELGGIHLVKVYNLKSGGPFNLGDPGEKPEGFDWDAWLGPAPERPYHQRIFGGGWHHFWDFSGGDMVDDGIHQMDLALMLMGDPGFPKAVACSGGRLAHAGDDSETPDVQIVTYEFDGFVLTFELTNYPRYMMKTTGTIRRNDELPYWTHNATRVELYGSEYMMTVGRHGGGWVVQQTGGSLKGEPHYGRVPDYPHWQDFIECVKTGKKPNADVETAHVACTMVHMGNIAYRLGNRKLWFDGEKQCFTGPDAEAANALLKRQYRAKYAVPEEV